MKDAPTGEALLPGRMASAAGRRQAVRVLVAEDCNVTRKMICRLLAADAGIEVAAQAVDGAAVVEEAHASARDGRPVDVVLLDVEMPVMDGLAVLPLLAMLDPAPRVIMVSALTRRGASITVEAMLRGAADSIAKPAGGRPTLQEFARDLIFKIKALGGHHQVEPPSPGAARIDRPALHPALAPAERRRAGPPRAAGPATAPPPIVAGIDPAPALPAAPALPRAQEAREAAGSIRIGPPRRRAAPALDGSLNIIAIGSSTGGPQALLRILRAVRSPLSLPLVITQHMQRGFTAILAEQLSRQTGLPVKEAEDGDEVAGTSILLAPGDRHMLFTIEGGDLRVRLSDAPPVHFCRPAVDPMLQSLVACGRRPLAVILTGMGSDGAIGCGAVVDAGGAVIIQDKASSVVWGMPGAVAARGISRQELPIDEIGPAILRRVGHEEGCRHAG